MQKTPTALRATASLCAAVLLLGACGTEPDADDAANASDPAETTQVPAEQSGEDEALPVYWVTDTDKAGPRLVREFVRVTTDDTLLSAADLVVSGEPMDPDYRSLWQAGEIESVTDDETTITVALSDDTWQDRPDGMDEKEAQQALQQMVFTLHGVTQARRPVVFTVDGEPATVFGFDTAAGIGQEAPLLALNLLSITSPETDDSVSGDSVEISGVANSFEANVVCELRQDGEVVASAPFTADGWMGDKLFPFSGELPLTDADAGPAQISCTTDDASGGEEGFGAFVDDKDITVG